mgnify:FL=1
MGIQLLEIGSDTEQLSACHLSLLLGVNTQDNKIQSFLKFARKILRARTAILTFIDEPYIWYVAQNSFNAVHRPAESNFSVYFDDHFFIDVQHPNYKKMSQSLSDLGFVHHRMVAIDLKEDAKSIGQLILFDEQQDAFDRDAIDSVKELAMSFLNILYLRMENAELKELYEQQVAMNVSKTKFFQIIAHDLRAPFHGLIGFSEVLAEERESLDESGIQSIADYLHDTAQSTYSLLESLLNWAMAEGGRSFYHPIHYKLKQSSQIVFDVLNGLAVNKNIQLIDRVPDDLRIFADINMVTSVIQNLVSNALKFTHMHGNGVVTIDAKQRDDFIDIYIQDTGLGMTHGQIESLFEPKLTISFKGTAGEKGTGLGLVLCKRFVDLNKGEISVTSKEGVGSTFIVSLPRSNSAHQALSLVSPQQEFIE